MIWRSGVSICVVRPTGKSLCRKTQRLRGRRCRFARPGRRRRRIRPICRPCGEEENFWWQISSDAAAHPLEHTDYPSRVVTCAKDQRSYSLVWRKDVFLVDGMALPASASIFAWYPVAGSVCNVSCGRLGKPRWTIRHAEGDRPEHGAAKSSKPCAGHSGRRPARRIRNRPHGGRRSTRLPYRPMRPVQWTIRRSSAFTLRISPAHPIDADAAG